MKFIVNLSNYLNKIAKIFVIFLMGFISILIFVQVIARYLFNHSLYWSEEVGRYILIWLTFLGASIGVKYNSHIGIDFFYAKSSKKIKKILDFAINFIGITFSLILFFYGIKLSWFVRFQKSAALLIPMTIPYLSIAIGGFIIFVHYLSKLIEGLNLNE